jgi:hypothetical protein
LRDTVRERYLHCASPSYIQSRRPTADRIAFARARSLTPLPLSCHIFRPHISSTMAGDKPEEGDKGTL